MEKIWFLGKKASKWLIGPPLMAAVALGTGCEMELRGPAAKSRAAAANSESTASGVDLNSQPTRSLTLSAQGLAIAGDCIAVDVLSHAEDGTESPLSVEAILQITDSGSGQFFEASDSTCQNAAITTLVFQAGQSRARVYFRDVHAESVDIGISITASDGTLTTAAASTGTVVFTAGEVNSVSLAVKSGSASSIIASGSTTTILEATARDANNNLVSGASVTLSIPANGGTTTSPATTNSAGIAAFTVTSSTTPGTYSYTASSNAKTSSSQNLTFSIGAPASIAVSTGNSQSAAPGAALTNPLVVVVRDANSNVISGATVNWAITAGGGNYGGSATTTSTTDASGLAQATLTLGAAAGANTATATVNGTALSTSFSATAVIPLPGSFSIATATATGADQVALAWGAASGATSYTVKYGTVSGTYGSTFSTTATSPTTVTGLATGTTYYFMVTAVNAGGSTNASAPLSATPTPLVGDAGLIGYWTLDSASISGTTASAVNGFGTSGTLMPTATAPTQVAGIVGGALSFDGTSQYVTLGNVMNPTAGITLAAWVKTTLNSRSQMIISKNGNTSNACSFDSAQSYYLALNANGTVLCALNRYDGVDQSLNGTTAVNDGNWHFVVCSADKSSSSNNWAIYVDGALNTTGTVANNGSAILATTTDVLTLGTGYRAMAGSCGMGSADSYNFSGSMDEVRIYNRGITAAEAQLLYTTTPSLSPILSTRTANTVFSLTTSGGITPYTYSIQSGGGSISSSGAFTAPATAGTSVVKIAGADGASATATIVTVASPTPSIVHSGLAFNLDAPYGTSGAPAGCTDTTWTDLIQGRYGTLNNVGNACAPSSGWKGIGTDADPYRLILDGTDDWVSVPTAVTKGLSKFSIAFWVRTSESRTNATFWNRPTLFGSASSGGSTGDFGVVSDGGKIGLWGGLNGGGDNSFVSDTTIGDNVWHHVAVTNDGGTLRLYVDGQSTATSSTLSSGLALHTHVFGIGAGPLDSGAGNYFHQGEFSQFSFYNKALTSDEVARTCNALKGRYSGATCAAHTTPTKLVVTGPSSILLSRCSSAYTVTAQNSSNVASDALSDITITPSAVGTSTFYSDSSCTLAVTNVTISSDSSTATFYVRAGASVGTLTLSAADAASNLTQAPSISTNVTDFNPNSYSGLALWLDAGSMNLSDGAAVDSWTDLSPALNHATQAGARKPTFRTNVVNGQPVLRFNDVNSTTGYLSFNRISTIRTGFLVIKHSPTLTDWDFILGDSSSYDFHGDAGGPLFSGYSAGAFNGGSGYVNGTSTSILSIAKPTANFAIISFVTTGNVSANQISEDRTYNRVWNGDIAEILIYTTPLDNTSRSAVECYLGSKYGLTVTGC